MILVVLEEGIPPIPAFRELIVRWFQFGAFSPIFRLHGHRLPNTDDFGGACQRSLVIWRRGLSNHPEIYVHA